MSEVRPGWSGQEPAEIFVSCKLTPGEGRLGSIPPTSAKRREAQQSGKIFFISSAISDRRKSFSSANPTGPPDRAFSRMKNAHALNYIDLTGRRFGRLTVLGLDDLTDNRMTVWRVRCDCGCEFTALGCNLRRGITRSCGCLRRDMMRGNKRNSLRP